MKGSVLPVLASALLCMLLFTACQDLISDNLCLPGIDLEKLHTQLKQELPSGLKGYTYLIVKNGKVKFTRSKGYARSPSDGLQYWDEFQKMHVASISKTITTVATMRLLKVKGLSLDEKFSKYLPPDWKIGPNVSSLSFRDLMSHRTGFLDVVNEDTTLSTVYDRLKTMVARGANGMKTRKYSNVHHALLRIILPILEDHPYTGGAIYDEARTARRYEQIVKLQVFVPLGIGGAALQDNDPNAGVLAYSSATDPSGVFETFDYRLRAGGYGWVLSAYDVAKFWAYLWHSNELLDEEQRQQMRSSLVGLWNSDNTITGPYYGKLGGWFRVDPPDSNGLKHALRSAAIEFRDGTAVVLFVNSPSARGLRDIIVTAYEKSYGGCPSS